MSIQAMSWAMSQQIVTDPSARHVLLCMSNYAGEDGRNAFPSILTLHKQTGLSLRTIQYKLREMEKAGVIKKGDAGIVKAHLKRADRQPVCYDICIERGATAAPRECVRGANDDTNGVQMTTSRGATAAPDTLLKANHQKENHAPADADLFFDVDEQVVSDFKKVRKAKKAPITATAIAGIRREAERADVSMQDALSMCCERGWIGFKADWVKPRDGYPPQPKPRKRKMLADAPGWDGRAAR